MFKSESASDGGARNVKEDETVGRKEVDNGVSDGAFSGNVREATLVSVENGERLSVGDGAAVGPFENALGFEFGEVFPYRILGDVEMCSEVANGDLPGLIDNGGDKVTTLIDKQSKHLLLSG